MSNTASQKVVYAFSALLVVLLALTMVLSLNVYSIPTAGADSIENILYEEDFSEGVDPSLSEHMVVNNGEATLSSGRMFNLPIASFPDSNNVELSFDLRLDAATDIYIHLVGLDGSLKANMFLGILGNGAYWRMSNQGFDLGGVQYDVYNNSGDDQGGLDSSPVDLSEFAHVQFNHYEGYLEVWVNGTRRVVSHLSNFGNTRYMQRGTIEEGKITGIAIHALNANAAVIDNVKVSEPTALATSYEQSFDSDSYGSKVILPLSAQNLYQDNFMVKATFNLGDATKTDYYPKVKLAGLNASLTTRNGKEYCVNVQAQVNEGTFNPGVFGQTETQDWVNASGEAVTFEQGDDIEFRVEVYGDNIDLYLNGKAAVATTFTELGLTKGKLQYIVLDCGGGGMTLEKVTFNGYDKQTAAYVSTPSTLVKTGSDVTFNADIFGIKGETFDWYVNDVKQNVEATELTLNAVEAGTYKVVYKSDATVSNEVVVNVVDKIATISTETPEIYATDSAVITAVLDGDFAGEDMKWYVNDAPQEEASTTLTLEGLSAGEYVIVYKGNTVSSNEITVTVLDSVVEVTTDQNSYFVGETATFEATLTGIPEGVTVEWYVDGELVEGQNETTFTLSLEGYEAGSQISVVAKAGEVTSEEVIISLAFDVLGGITGDENYKVVYEDVIEDGGSYGNFSVGSDEDGTYLYSQNTSGSTWYEPNATMPSSTSFILTYQLYIPADIDGTYYVYPCLAGLNSKYPSGLVESAIEVNSEGVRPYFKEQSNGMQYEVKDYGFGKDLSYEGGIAKKGDWNEIAVAVKGSYVTMYVNGEITMFFNMPTATVPSRVSFNLYPDGGSGVVPVRIKGIEVSGIVEPAPDLVSVSLSVSNVETEVDGTITVRANLNPFNAEANVIEWYVNDVKVEGQNTLNFTFSASATGEYNIHCVIDGIKSEVRTVKVVGAGGGNGAGDGATLPGWAIAIIVIGALAVVGGAAAGIVIAMKKKNAKAENVANEEDKDNN